MPFCACYNCAHLIRLIIAEEDRWQQGLRRLGSDRLRQSTNADLPINGEGLFRSLFTNGGLQALGEQDGLAGDFAMGRRRWTFIAVLITAPAS